MKRINAIGWLMIGLALLYALRYAIPLFDEFLGHPSRTSVQIAIVLSALCFGFYGINKPAK